MGARSSSGTDGERDVDHIKLVSEEPPPDSRELPFFPICVFTQ